MLFKQNVFINFVILFRHRLSDLELRLNSQHLEDRLAALQELELRKNRELEASKGGWEEQIKQLSSQVYVVRLFFVEINIFLRFFKVEIEEKYFDLLKSLKMLN